MNPRHASRDLVRIASFGTLWGLVEISLGAFLKGFKIPLSGLMLGCVSAYLCLTAWFFIRRRGGLVFMGIVAALVKLFSVGAVILSPVLAILAEALVAEYMVRIRGFSRLSYGLTGTAVVMYTLVHPLLTQGLIFGTGIFRIYIETFRKLADIMGMDPLHLVWVGGAYVCIHGIMGILSGLAAHGTARAVQRELQARRECSP